jgi:hypothetical protein
MSRPASFWNAVATIQNQISSEIPSIPGYELPSSECDKLRKLAEAIQAVISRECPIIQPEP